MRRQRHGGESHGKTEAELGVILLQAGECQGLPATNRGWKREGTILPRVSEGKQPYRYPDFGHLIFKTVKEYISVVLSPPVCGNLLLSPWKLLHRMMLDQGHVAQLSLKPGVSNYKFRIWSTIGMFPAAARRAPVVHRAGGAPSQASICIYHNSQGTPL